MTGPVYVPPGIVSREGSLNTEVIYMDPIHIIGLPGTINSDVPPAPQSTQPRKAGVLPWVILAIAGAAYVLLQKG